MSDHDEKRRNEERRDDEKKEEERRRDEPGPFTVPRESRTGGMSHGGACRGA
jgi:hypothetical protein